MYSLQEGPVRACEEMLHSMLGKLGGFGGRNDAGVLFLQAESQVLTLSIILLELN